MQHEITQLSQYIEDMSSEPQPSAQLERLLAKTALRIRRSLNLDKVLKTTASEVRQILKAERVMIYRFNANWGGIVAVESVNEDVSSLLGKEIYDDCFAQDWVELYRNGRIQITGDIHLDGLSQCHIDLLISMQIRANLVVPILISQEGDRAENQLWGLLAVQQCTAPRQWQPWEVEFIKQLSEQVAIAIQRAELYEQLMGEVIERKRAEIEMRRLNWQLERKVIERTVELAEANEKLEQEIDERQRIEEDLFQEKELAQITLQSIGDAVITTDIEGKIEYYNPIAEQLTGWKVSEVKGLLLSSIFNIVNEVTREPVANPIEMALRKGQIVGLPERTLLIDRNGKEYAIDDSAAPIRDRNGQIVGAVMVFHDVTHSRTLARELSWQATHDSLTELVNRQEFERQLVDAIASAKNDDLCHALCYLDLDQFKIVNDTCGHVAGDELLRQVTHLLQKRIRSTDILARLGGDEFGLLLYKCPLPQAQQIADTLRQLIQNFRFSWDGKTFSIGVSIGIVLIGADSRDLNSILGEADAACYGAKSNGRNCIHVYLPDDRELAQQRGERQWIARIHQALEENRFRLYRQKIVSLSERSELHYEILLRLIDETGELVSPMAFIPAAERYDLMPAIDSWTINTFLNNYERLCQNTSHVNEGWYSLNLSGASINNPRFLEFLKEKLARYSSYCQNICFEITETTAIANLVQVAQSMSELKQFGCHFALDDFGSGVSSLAYLKNLPIDYLKIDGSFVKNIICDRVDYVMVESLNQIAHAMNIKTIAEFVENEEIIEKLDEMGVDYAQGYGIAKPSPF
jgi:diguanylate cyclase (GGDEF)-like protein/PAS domain S-box-containing protein